MEMQIFKDTDIYGTHNVNGINMHHSQGLSNTKDLSNTALLNPSSMHVPIRTPIDISDIYAITHAMVS